MQVVVAGAGQAGLQTAASLREFGFAGTIVLVGAESVPPYQRPPLSKSYLTGPPGVDRVALRAPAFYRDRRIRLELDARVAEIDRAAARVRLSTGAWLRYDRLVCAFGAEPRQLDVPGADLDGVLTVRTVADADAVRSGLAVPGRRVVVVGGGFLGLELAAAVRDGDHAVTVVEAADRVLARVCSPAVAEHLAGVHRDRGTTVLTPLTVRALLDDDRGRVAAVELSDGRALPADLVLVAVGAVPRTGPAAAAGLVVEDGIVVDAALRTADPAVLAVGDCARFPGPDAGRTIRLESVQNAVDQARFVAAGICDGRAVGRYTELPWFWSAQFGENLQIAGLVTGGDQAVTVGDRAGGRFSVLGFAGDRLRSVESVNRPADHLAARRMLASGAGPSPVEAARPGYGLMDHARRAGLFDPAPDQRAG